MLLFSLNALKSIHSTVYLPCYVTNIHHLQRLFAWSVASTWHIFMPRCAQRTNSICPELFLDSANDVGLRMWGCTREPYLSTFHEVCIVLCLRRQSWLYTFKWLLLYKVPALLNHIKLSGLLIVRLSLTRPFKLSTAGYHTLTRTYWHFGERLQCTHFLSQCSVFAF